MATDFRLTDWTSIETHFFENPKWDLKTKQWVRQIQLGAPSLDGHIWIQSSGSSAGIDQSPKWIALSKKAFLVSAEAVNKHLEARAKDRWGCALPTFHVGGLSIFARAFLAGSAVSTWSENWDPVRFLHWIKTEKVSLLSLVPTQLFDLLQLGQNCPESLRAIVIGGAKLPDRLYEKALTLKWPVLPSFGMTELCSQVATATAGRSELRFLSHVQAKTDNDSRLWLKSESLMTGHLIVKGSEVIWFPVETCDGFWKTQDQAAVEKSTLIPLGRSRDYVKIKGEALNLTFLREKFDHWLEQAAMQSAFCALVALPDERNGAKLVLAVERIDQSLEGVVHKWNEQCFSIERIAIQKVQRIPKSELGKVQWKKLSQELAGLISPE